MKTEKRSILLLGKWIVVILTVISLLSISLSNFIGIEDYLFVWLVTYVIVSMFFLQPLFKSILENGYTKTMFVSKYSFIVQGISGISLFYSSYRVFISVNARIDVWFWV